jgi:hypothetical protein
MLSIATEKSISDMLLFFNCLVTFIADARPASFTDELLMY